MSSSRKSSKRGYQDQGEPYAEKDVSSKLPSKKKQKLTTNNTKRDQPQKTLSRPTRGNGPHLSKLLKVYKGTEDWHLPIFRNIRTYMEQYPPENGKTWSVLYPGSSRHITTSLVFSDVTYVDTDKNVESFFKDERVLQWVQNHKEYGQYPVVRFLCKKFDSGSLGPTASYDLMISASAGIVSTPCSKYLKSGGYFLVSDAHFDARHVFVNHRQQFQLVAAFDNDGTIHVLPTELEGHFTTTTGDVLTSAQVEESKVKPKARRSFKLQKEGLFYLFQKK